MSTQYTQHTAEVLRTQNLQSNDHVYRVADGSRLVNVNVFDEDITIPFKVDPSLLLYDHPIVANYLGRCIRATNQKQVNKYLEMEVTDFRYKFFIILEHYI